MSEFTSELLSKVVKAQEDYKNVVNEASKVFKEEVFAGFFKPFLDKHPVVGGFAWVQYTPYFNDGEPCEFGVHDLSALTQEDIDNNDIDSYQHSALFYVPSKEVYEYLFGDTNLLKNKYESCSPNSYPRTYYKTFAEYAKSATAEYAKYTKEEIDNVVNVIKDIELFDGVFRKFPKDVMANAFGDGVKVIVSRKGIEVESYDHD